MKTQDQKTVRAFIAVRVPLELAAILHKKAQHRAGDLLQHKLRWMVPQQQHVTLKFLGECDDTSLEQYAHTLEHALTDMQTFDCMTGCFEFFPDAHQPRELALNMHSGQQLNTLARICERTAKECGMRRELRNFRPHVTLARFNQHHHVTHSDFFNIPSYRMNVSEIVLMKSETTEEGTRYSEMKRFSLQPLAKSA
ncbi:RNA 2',3'-cyclic phosphodiesterase [Endozoicomonas sp. OPT23]|uniref:RNA 2',3'-cyclic phosphodiesterase n=1 Tax=Endozoicomonas sp. OPT23 TaxID=2072845 RepID=UPI00129BDBCB|nr:RNA 2',3'-cyclic phosphodiesterase [Endozoicomonas sp. OPT23]MRI34726.1 RNA 2',3'-cyclic phosphodiesterase [Endozoicomonas sp. OPT23]